MPVLAAAVQLACSGIKKDTGYTKVKPTISSDSAARLKARMVKEISNNVFDSFQYTGANNSGIYYRLLRPQQVDKEKRYPLVLVLHGSGVEGTDNSRQLGILPKLWARPEIRAQYPAYVVVPQFPRRSSNYSLNAQKNVLASVPDICLNTALQLVDSLKKALPVDDRKIYVMGFSMGASSTINSLELQQGLFAAAVAISGIPAFEHINTLATTPLWIIHGNADQENPFASDSLLYKELVALHHRHLRFWEVDQLDHQVYSELYTSDIIPRWLFSHSMNKPGSAAFH